MKKLICLFILLSSTADSYAQDFVIEMPRRRDEFAQDLISLLNSAPYKFSFIKGKQLSSADSLHPKAKIFLPKMKLKGALSGRIEQDSSFSFIEFVFPDIKTQEEAEASYTNLINKVTEALRKKVLFKKSENDTTSFTKQTKIAYASHSGFFDFNIIVRLSKINKPDVYRLQLHIDGGKPKYFYRLQKNEPIVSFIFSKPFRQSIQDFEMDFIEKNCLGDIPMFVCNGKKLKGDTVMINYSKKGFHDLPDVKSEFDAMFTNIRAGFNNEYVYSQSLPAANILRQIVFVKYEDMDKPIHKSVHLDLIQQTNRNYAIEINFVY